MKKILAIVMSGCLCLCMFGCGGSSTPAPAPVETALSQEQDTATSDAPENEKEAEVVSEAAEVPGKVEDIIGDWSGQTEVHLDYNEGPFEAVLSINSDNTWASCVNGSFNWGTWEAASERGNRVILTVQYAGTDATNTWSFEKHPDGYYYEYVSVEVIEIPMTKMGAEDAEKIYNDWYGEVTYHDDFYDEDETAKASIALNSDGTWSSDVSGSNNNGNIRYVSDAGHIVVLDVVYEGTDATNQWGVIKKPDGKYYYEYYHGQLIEIPIDPL